MLRCKIELVPGGDESRARTIGLVEIVNVGSRADGLSDYAVVLKKTPPFAGALRQAWRSGRMTSSNDVYLTDVDVGEDEEAFYARVSGHHRTRRGAYDLLYRALRACGLENRLPKEERS